MPLFIIVVVLLFLLLDSYVFVRGWQALEGLKKTRIVYTVLFWAVALLFFPAIVLKRNTDSVFLETVWTVAAFWMAAMAYLVIMLAAIDLHRLLRLLWLLLVKEPMAVAIKSYKGLKRGFFVAVSLSLIVLLCVGYMNATRPYVSEYEVEATSRRVADEREVTVVLVSDLHLGLVNGRKHLGRWVESINRLNPDLVLLAGDVFDDNPQPAERKRLGELLREIDAPLGRYAIPGNHELMGDFYHAADYLQQSGVTVLADCSVLIDSLFCLTGRMDRSVSRRIVADSFPARAALSELIKPYADDYPVVVLDHQPADLDEAARLGVAMQLSGHTHRGQMWPLSYITDAVYECDHGMLGKAGTTFIVSSGLGTWGPPIRVGSRSEIVLIRFKIVP